MSDLARLKRGDEPRLSRELEEALARAAGHVMTAEEIRAWRISFAYGQMMDCAPNVTKEEVARIHDEMWP